MIVTKVLDVRQDIIATEPNVFRNAQMSHILISVKIHAKTVIQTVLLVMEVHRQIASHVN